MKLWKNSFDVMKSFGAGTLTSFTDGFTLAAEKTGGFAAALSSALPAILAIVAVVGMAAIAYDHFVETFDEAAKAADEAAAKYEKTKSEISSLESELETTSARIDELNAKDGLTLVEQDELAKLYETNDQLEKQLALKRQMAENEGLAAANAAKNALTNEGFITYNDGSTMKRNFFTDILNSVGQSMALSSASQMVAYDGGKTYQMVKENQSENLNIIEATIRKQQRLNELQNEQSTILDHSSDRYIELGDQIATLSGEVSSNWNTIDQYKQTIIDAGLAETADFKNVIESIDHLDNYILGYEALDSNGSWIETELGKRQKEIEQLESFLSKPSIKDSLKSLKEYLSENNDASLDDIIAQFPELASAAEAAKVDIVDVVDSIKSELGLLNLDNVRDQLSKALDVSSFTGDSQKWLNESWQNWINSLSDEEIKLLYGIYQSNNTSAWTFEDWQLALEEAKASADGASDGIVSDFDAIQQKTAETAEATEKLASSFSKVQSVLSSQQAGKSISLADFNSEELQDYTSALEYNNGTLQLNAEKVRELVQAKSEEQIAINDANKAMAQSEYLENAAQIEQYREKLRTSTDLTKEQRDTIYSEIEALQAQNADLKNACSQYDIMSQSLREATDAYHNWLNAQSASDYGDMFNDSLNAFQRIMDTYDSDSDIFGNFGSKKFDAAVEFWIPDSVDSSDIDNIKSYMDSVSKYLTFDDNGKADGLNIEKFCQEAVDKGLMILDEASDEYQIAGQMTMEDFANGMNLALPIVQAFFDQMQLKGGDFSWADEAIKTVGDLAVEATEAAEQLQLLNGININIDVSDIEDADEKCAALDRTIQQMQDLKAEVGADATQIEYANSVIQYCIAQKQMLNEPAVMYVDTSAVSENVGIAISKIQEFITLSNQIEQMKALGIDTSAAEQKLDTLRGEIQGLDSTVPNINATLGLDTSSVENLQASISAIEAPELMTKLGIDESAIIGYEAPDKDSTVVYGVDSTEPDNYKAPNKSAVVTFMKNSWAVDSYNPRNLSRTVTYHIHTVGTPPAVNGTAHAGGTAAAGGDWGTAPGGMTLVGELGREIVVDPYTGRWYTVGDTGAEFAYVPKGAIVFNHKQTESLLENGYVTGRATALVGGTAMVTGGIKRQYASYTNGATYKNTSTKSSGGYSSGNSNYNSVSQSTAVNSTKSTSTSDAESEFEKLYKYHQHLLAMDAESVEDYLNWLNKAYKEAYKNNQIELDDYYKY